MKEVAGAGWASNLSGQLEYLMIELRGSYRGCYDAMLALPNTLEGALEATAIFVTKFEVPLDTEGAISRRKPIAVTFWSSLVQ